MTPLYANFCNIQNSEDAILLLFGIGAGAQNIPVSQLMVTPKFLKQLEAAIVSAVAKYEREHCFISDGSIMVPKARVPEVN